MRRAAIAVVVGGLALGGNPGSASADGTRTQTVVYGGYEITVPASWPVYWLGRDPERCVRYDVNAVYLGTPGPDQQCPPGIVGRTDTVSIASPARFQSAAVGGAPAQPGTTGGQEVRLVPALHAAVMMNGASHQLRVATSANDAVVTATYGTDPGVAVQVLGTVRSVGSVGSVGRGGRPPQDAPRAWGAARPPYPPGGGLAPVTAGGGLAPVTAGGGLAPVTAGGGLVPGVADQQPGVADLEPGAGSQPAVVSSESPSGWGPAPEPTSGGPTPVPTGGAVAPPKRRTPAVLPGFDACTAPSLRAMRAWRSKYAVAGIYVGGSNMACDYGNLSAGWVSAVTKMGWGLLPLYVGPQAPCYGYGDMINAKHAASQGQAAAQDAVSEAALFGLPAGSPVYYDMEAYNEEDRHCVAAVMAFLSSWTTTLNELGYLSGVYSSANSGVRDLQSAAVAGSMAEPQAIWFALWDKKRNLTGTRVLKPAPWPSGDRVKQYAGGHLEKIGGVSLDIDSDLVGGLVARLTMPG